MYKSKGALPLTHAQQSRILKARKSGKGLNLKFSRTQVKKGGVLPLLLPGLAALGALAGGSAAIARAVSGSKNNARQLQELKRHNAAMEALALRRGSGLKKRKTKPKRKRQPKQQKKRQPKQKRKATKKKNSSRGQGFFLKPAFR